MREHVFRLLFYPYESYSGLFGEEYSSGEGKFHDVNCAIDKSEKIERDSRSASRPVLFLRERRSADDRLRPDKRRDNSFGGEVKRFDR